MKSLTIALLTATVVVAACGPTVRYVYNKPEVSPELRQRDESECATQATVTVPDKYGYGEAFEVFDQNRLTRCMASRGYEVQEIKE